MTKNRGKWQSHGGDAAVFFKGLVAMVTAAGQTGQGPCCAHHPHMADQSQPFNLSIYRNVWTVETQASVTHKLWFRMGDFFFFQSGDVFAGYK